MSVSYQQLLASVSTVAEWSKAMMVREKISKNQQITGLRHALDNLSEIPC